MAREGQGYPCYQRDMMMMIIDVVYFFRNISLPLVVPYQLKGELNVSGFEISSSRRICTKPLLKSILEKYFAPCISAKISFPVGS